MSIEAEIRFLGKGEDLSAPAGLSSPEAILRKSPALWIGPLLRRDSLIGRNRLFGSLTVLSLKGAGKTTYYVMRFPAASASSARRLASKELQAAGRLMRAGIDTARPVARGFGALSAGGGGERGMGGGVSARRRRGGLETAAFVVVSAPKDAVPLDRFLRERGGGALWLAILLARRIASLHGAGVRVPGLCAWNVLVLPREKSFVFLGSLGARRSRGPRRSSFLDLAPLSATLEATAVSRALRLLFLKHYIDEARAFLPLGDPRDLWRKVEGEERRLRRSGLLPRAFPIKERIFPHAYFQTVRSFGADLEGSGFASADDFISPSGRGVRLLRGKENRSNYALDTGGGRYYLKVHRESPRAAPLPGIAPGAPLPSLRRLIREALPRAFRRSLPQGFREWRGFLSLFRFGLPVPPPAAWGVARGTSFFAVRDEGGIPLDDLLRGSESPFPWRPGGAGAFRRRIAREAGRLVGRFHGAGFFHHDLYLCHLLAGTKGLSFIDLQRIEEAPLFRRHGVVKDLAALYHSSLSTPVTAADRLRFFLAWKGGGPLSARDRKLLAAIERKRRAIASRSERRRGGGKTGRAPEREGGV